MPKCLLKTSQYNNLFSPKTMTTNIPDRKLFTCKYPNHGFQNKDCMFKYKEFIIPFISVEPSLALVYRTQPNSPWEASHLAFTWFPFSLLDRFKGGNVPAIRPSPLDPPEGEYTEATVFEALKVAASGW